MRQTGNKERRNAVFKIIKQHWFTWQFFQNILNTKFYIYATRADAVADSLKKEQENLINKMSF